MNQPEPTFMISGGERTRGGALSVDNVNRVARMLLSGGFAVLPSDTAYSVAAIAVTGSTRTTINTLLGRANMAVSMAFPSMPAVRRWIQPSPVVEKILGRYCPGPITVVCPGSLELPASFFSEGARGPNLTIGVRIPDSVVERDVAAATGYPITTVAVRDRATGAVVTSFDEALAVVEAGMVEIGGAPWCAVEGTEFYPAHSTVVAVTGDGRIEEKRPGDIPFADIEAAIR
ncbi:MAG TPA: Sua5/YciO/YrdC/YwlC family protein [Catenuloplanes sp.]|jgi:L-threonylcarbamoyladenylate synthase